MALMNTLRNKMGKVVVGMIAIAILSFVLTDLLGGQNSVFLRGDDRTVGEIAGEEIDIEEYQNMVDAMKVDYRNRTGESPNQFVERTLREQAWQYMIVEKAFTKVFAEAEMVVEDEELFDMVQGKNISPSIQQVRDFINPQTGRYDVEYARRVIASLNQTPEGRVRWAEFEQSLIPERLRIKYDNLLMKTSFASTWEAEREYRSQTALAEAKYLYIPYTTIPYDSVEVTESELKKYLSSHPDDNKVDWSRSVKYITFPIIPSAQDSLDYREELREIKEELESTEDDSVYASVISEKAPYFEEYAIYQLPDVLQSNLNILNKGDVIGPYLDNNDYLVYKISDEFEDETGYARASHIQINWDDDSDEAKAKAREEANRILREVRGGADFAEVAKDNSKDGGSAIRGGDLGWFDSDKLVRPFSEPFNEAVFAATTTGIINKVIESDYGYHIINVTEIPSNTRYKIAMVRREIEASDKTRDMAFREADYFAGTNENLNDFLASAKQDTLIVKDAEDIKQNDFDITGLTGARQLVSWLFNQASEAEVSPVYEIEDNYVVAVMTGETEEGTADLESVRLAIEEKVKNEKIAERIAEKISANSGSIDELAELFGEGASVYESSDLRLNSDNLPSVGTAPEVIGKVFSMNSGDVSEPIPVEYGVVVISLVSITDAPDIADFTSYKNYLEQTISNNTSGYVGNVIREWADIEDRRYKFY